MKIRLKSGLVNTFITTAKAQALLATLLQRLADYQQTDWNIAVQQNYKHDAASRIIGTAHVIYSQVEPHQQYSYTPGRRLQNVTIDEGAQAQTTSWTYDTNGNRTNENGPQIAEYDQQDRLPPGKPTPTVTTQQATYRKGGEPACRPALPLEHQLCDSTDNEMTGLA